jgi:hypothetical protein
MVGMVAVIVGASIWLSGRPGHARTIRDVHDKPREIGIDEPRAPGLSFADGTPQRDTKFWSTQQPDGTWLPHDFPTSGDHRG